MRLALAFGIVLLVVAVPAMAVDEGFDAQLFRPAIFSGNFVAIEDSNILCPWSFGVGLYLDYARGPLTLFVDDDPDFDFMSHLYSAHLTIAGGISDWFGLGVAVPLHFASVRRVADLAETSGVSDLADKVSMGDIRAEIKFRALRQDKHWLSLAIAPFATFEVGDESRFFGEGRITGGGNLILEHDFKAINVALNAGYQYRGSSGLFDTEVGDAVRWGAGLSRDFANGLGFSVEYWGSWYAIKDEDTLRNLPMELTATLRYRFGARGPRILVGGGPGLTHGLATPSYRLLAGLDYKWCRPKPTEGVLEVQVTTVDGKPLAATLEVVGRDGKPTSIETNGEWKAKLAAGTYSVTAAKEGYISRIARPAVSIGKTTTVTFALRVKEVPPPPPTLLFVDVVDRATSAKIPADLIFGPQTPEEKKITLPAGELNQPWNPGAYRVQATSKGYETTWTDVTVVAEKSTRVVIQLRKKIELIDKIYFAKNSAVILPKSKPVLDDVVKKIKSLDTFKKIVVEGHCSSEASDEYNLKLSQQRTESVVEYLAKKGIDKAKLEPIGYGESRPIATNDTEEGRSENRRVEFILEE
jgi:outer membrane protein OmpA-like peptidoglycan-associated protein